MSPHFAALLVAGFVAGLVLAVGHYAIGRALEAKPLSDDKHTWKDRTGRPMLHPVLNYMYGTVTLLSAWTGWALYCGFSWFLALSPWAIAIAAGACDMATYLLDTWVESRKTERENDARKPAGDD